MRAMSPLAPSLTPNDYVDPDVFALECESVLAGTWLPLCRADQLAEPGARIAMTLVGRPVVAVRDGDAIRVLANVCAHRGSLIVDEGPGAGSTLVCPYHRWAYRLDGSLIGAPLGEGTDLDGVCLPVVRHAIWEGFVLVNLSGTAPDPGEQLGRALRAPVAVALVRDGDRGVAAVRLDVELEGDGRELDRVLPPPRHAP